MRPIWSGAINFGLIHIPVKLYKASQEQRFHFRYLHKDDLCPIKYMKVCKYTGEEVDYKDIVRGYEYEKGDYVILKDEDFQKINPDKYQSINITKFVKEDEIDPKYIEKPYYLEPGENAESPYVLLREALKKTKKVGVGKFMLRNKEHLAAVRAESDMIVLEQLRFNKEVIKPNQLNVPKRRKISKQELGMAVQLIDQLTSQFKPEEFRDTYSQELKKLVEAKKKGRLDKIKIEKRQPPKEIPDIMDQLKKSLEKNKQKQ